MHGLQGGGDAIAGSTFRSSLGKRVTVVNIVVIWPHPSRQRAPNTSAGSHSQKGIFMNLHLTIGPVVSIIAGILILIMPRLLNYIVAIYLILIGLLELSGNGGLHLH
jgi:hypothetical protein